MKKKVIIIYSMSRSGHHAIINWLQENWRGSSSHFNHCYRGWHDQKLIPGKGSLMGNQVKKTEYDFEQKLEIYSIEDFDPSAYKRFGMNDFPIIADPNNEVKHVLIMRDPYNWLASSWLRGIHPTITYINETGFAGTRIELFEKHIAAFDNFFNASNFTYSLPQLTLSIVFNNWFASESYRDQVLNLLGMPRDGVGMKNDKVCSETSFYEDLGKESGQDLDVLGRWKYFTPMGNHQYYWKCISNCMKAFSTSVCGLDPAQLEREKHATVES